MTKDYSRPLKKLICEGVGNLGRQRPLFSYMLSKSGCDVIVGKVDE